MRIEIAVFDGLDELDALGPFEVLRQGWRAGAAVDCALVTLDGQREVVGANGLRFAAEGALGEPDWLVVPGGGWMDRAERGAWGEVERGTLPRAISAAHARGASVASVCTGAMIVAAAGLLRGRPATTHHSAHGELAATGAEVVTARVVDDGDIVTAGGVTSGLDLGLRLLERVAGAEAAAAVARELEIVPGVVRCTRSNPRAR
jgi:transcriptional regulator GlxA family with amidase domain